MFQMKDPSTTISIINVPKSKIDDPSITTLFEIFNKQKLAAVQRLPVSRSPLTKMLGMNLFEIKQKRVLAFNFMKTTLDQLIKTDPINTINSGLMETYCKKNVNYITQNQAIQILTTRCPKVSINLI